MYLVTTSNTIKVIFMNIFYDANKIYEAGTKAIQGAPFKYQSQLFEMNHLIETAQILKDLKEWKYKPVAGKKFTINERGKIRHITSNNMVDKTINHLLCDNVLSPAISPYLLSILNTSNRFFKIHIVIFASSGFTFLKKYCNFFKHKS